jgi:hypothetical protein
MTPQTVVYILSSKHSGSTLLGFLLGSHSQVALVGHLENFERRLRDKGVAECKVCGGRCEVWDRYMQVLERPYYHRAALEAFGKPILVDTSQVASWAASNRPYVERNVYVYLLRHGLASLRRTKNRRGGLTRGLIEEWKGAHCDIQAFLASVPSEDQIVVRYEDLATDPPTVLRQICGVIGIDYDQAMLKYWLAEHHALSGNNKPFNVVHLHQQKLRTDNLGQEERNFFEEVGYGIELDTRYLNEYPPREVRLFNLLAGRFHKRLGYPRPRPRDYHMAPAADADRDD